MTNISEAPHPNPPTATVEDVARDKFPHGGRVTVYGIGGAVRHKESTRNRPWCQFDLSGTERRIPVMLHPDEYAQYKDALSVRWEDGPLAVPVPVLVVTGHVDRHDPAATRIVADAVTRLPMPPTYRYGDDIVPILKSFLESYPPAPRYHPDRPKFGYQTHGIELGWIGEDGDMVAHGHIVPELFIAACNQIARSEAGLANVVDDERVDREDLVRAVQHVWAVRLPKCGRNDHIDCLSDDFDCDPDPEAWSLDYGRPIDAGTPGAFPVTLALWSCA